MQEEKKSYIPCKFKLVCKRKDAKYAEITGSKIILISVFSALSAPLRCF
jgi:hypothetical protein